MNRYRQKHPDHGKAPPDSTFGELTDNPAAVAGAGEDIYSEAEKHRAGVIAKDKAAKARRKAGRRG